MGSRSAGRKRVVDDKTDPTARYLPCRSPFITVEPYPPSSFHLLMHLRSPTSHTYTSASEPRVRSSLRPSAPEWRAHHSARTPLFIFTLPTTCAAPLVRQWTRCTCPRRPAMASTLPVGSNAHISIPRSACACTAAALPHRPRGERVVCPDCRSRV